MYQCISETFVLIFIDNSDYLFDCSVVKLNKNEMGGACSTYGEEERCIEGFGGETCGKGFYEPWGSIKYGEFRD
jgi:hypothetical protein